MLSYITVAIDTLNKDGKKNQYLKKTTKSWSDIFSKKNFRGENRKLWSAIAINIWINMDGNWRY